MRNGKKTLSLIAVLLTFALLFGTFPLGVLANEAELVEDRITGSTSASVKQGDTGYCYVDIASLEDVSSLSVAVHYDPTKIEIISAYNSVSAEVYDSVIDDTFVQFSYVFDGNGANTQQQLFYFRYRVLSDAELGNSYFDIVVNEAYNGEYVPTEVKGSRCSFNIAEKVVSKTCYTYSSSASISSAINEEFELTFRLSSSYKIASGAFVINYDSELFELVSVSDAAFLKNATVDVNTELKGSVYISFVGESGKTYGDFVKVKFKTIKNTNETSRISFSSTDIYDENYDPVYCSGTKVDATVLYDATCVGDAPDMYLIPDYSYENQKLTLTVKLAKDSHLGAGDFTLKFDADNFKYSSYVQGVEAYRFTVNDKNAKNGELKISYISFTDLVDEETFVTIVFDTPYFCEDVKGAFDIEASGLCDSMTNPIMLHLVDANISIPTLAGHNITKYEAKAPTCTEIGWDAYEACSYCDYSTYVEIPATGHNITSHNAKEPTCTDIGWHAYEDCSKCDYTTYVEIPANGHSYSITVTAPTCLTQGYTLHSCGDCGHTFVDTYVDALGHAFSAWTETKAPTCTEKGEEKRECSRCEHVETREVSATGHSHNALVTKPTCTTGGYTTHTCHCGDEYVDNYTNALGHDLGAWTEIKTPSCTEMGTERRECSSCEYYETRDVGTIAHSYTAVVTKPTCTTGGYTTHTCHCGDEYVDNYTNALGHDLGAWAETKAPTCTEKGEEKRSCSRCDYVETREVNATGHSYNAVVTKPSCTMGGYTTHTCHCGDEYVDNYTNALGHNLSVWTETKVPTCTEKGEEKRECSRCDYFETREVVETNHIPGDWIVDAEATFESNGSKHKECVICHTVVEESFIPMLKHSYVSTVTDPTCTEQGYTTHICSECGDSYVDDYTNALGHNLGAWTQTKAPTCTEKGLERSDCSRCDYYETRDVNATNHSYSSVTTEPTCTDRGYTTYTCHCGDTYVDTYIAALGHNLSAWTETKAPTCTEAGEEKRECSRCDYCETREISATGHSHNAAVTKPTCTERGYTTYTCHCGNSYVDTYVDALGHNFGDWTQAEAPTCTEKGSDRRDCTRCEHFETREINATGHSHNAVITTPTCTDRGYTTHTCHCGNSYVDTYVTALGHNLGDWAQTKAPTCAETGEERRSCSRCDYSETRNIARIAHSYALMVTAPTCTEKGYTSHICTVCRDTWVDTYIDALGHKIVEWQESNAPTCIAKGKECGQCIRCDYSENRDIDALGHTEITDEAKEPTCTEAGLTAGKHCSVCNEVLVAQSIIPALGHVWADATQEEPSTCELCGATTGDKLPDKTPSTDDEVIYEDSHVCDGGNGWSRFWTLIFNFFRRIFGLPETCPHGIKELQNQ